MSQYQNDDDPDPGVPTFAVAKKQRKELIAQLAEGDAGERRQAKALSQCSKGRRCHLMLCPVCERREDLARWRVPAGVVKSINGFKAPREFYLRDIEVVGKHRSLNEKKVRALAASMDLIGQQMPITIRMQKKNVILVSGWHRVAAAKRLGWDSILCVELYGDRTDARLWQLMENLYRAELTVLQRAEHIDELRTLVQAKAEGGQAAPPADASPKMSESRRPPRCLASSGKKFVGPRPSREFRRRQRRQR